MFPFTRAHTYSIYTHSLFPTYSQQKVTSYIFWNVNRLIAIPNSFSPRDIFLWYQLLLYIPMFSFTYILLIFQEIQSVRALYVPGINHTYRRAILQKKVQCLCFYLYALFFHSVCLSIVVFWTCVHCSFMWAGTEPFHSMNNSKTVFLMVTIPSW